MWAEWSEVPPQDYLKPFLAVIQSGETGGQITAVALSAVARILSEYVIGKLKDLLRILQTALTASDTPSCVAVDVSASKESDVLACHI